MPAEPQTRFHLSLNVADLPRSVAFFRILFGQEPAKLRPDYAKFEPGEPALVLSLEPQAPGSSGVLNHVGIRLPDPQSLVTVQRRLEAAGIRCQREEGVECCYAKQTKFWLRDPDGTLWEMYTFEGDLDHRGVGQAQDVVLVNTPTLSASVVWEHRMDQLLPECLPLADGSADEVRLRGTFNLPLSTEQQQTIMNEVERALKPGGRLFVHVLTSDQTVEAPALPGPAAVVRFVPREQEPLRLLVEAGFSAVRLLKFDAKPCFVRAGVEMRETQMEAWKPIAPPIEATQTVLYRGPFDQVELDGQTYRRGMRVTVPESVAERFQQPDWAAFFTVFPATVRRPEGAPACGAGCG
ncbi:MAG: VOC family protein [Bacteroidales bacterium]|nr:VOC family protein [Bacteroidales bacterium]